MSFKTADNSRQKMKESATLHAEHILQSTLDALASHIAILNGKGEIVAVNEAWHHFSKSNQGSVICCGVGENYLDACHSTNDRMQEAALGIQKVLSDEDEEFRFEYTCNKAACERWFNIHVTRFQEGNGTYLVIVHENITEHKKREKELERISRLYSSLSHINQAIVRITSRDDFFRQVCRFLVQEGGFSIAWIGWHDEETHRIVPIADWGDEKGGLKNIKVYGDDRPEGRGPAGRTLRDGQPHICNDFYADPTTQPWQDGARQKGINAAAVFPIRSNGPVCGTLSVYATEVGFFQDKEVALLNEVASSISFALDSFQVEQQRKQAETALQQMREELELRVQQRTAELERANDSLQEEIAERKASEAKAQMRKRQQEAVTTLGQQALANVDVEIIMQNIADYVVSTMDVELSSIIELSPDHDYLHFRAGTGWKSDISNLSIPHDSNSHFSYTLSQRVPLIITDLENETRFTLPPHLLSEGIVSGVMVVVGGGRSPLGILGAFTRKPWLFDKADIYIMQSMAHILSSAIDQQRISREVNQLNAHFQETNEELEIRNEERLAALQELEKSAEVLEQAKVDADLARESAESANRTKNEFLSRMSHELRTPLNAILGFGQILDEQELSPFQKESVKYIIKGGRHLLNLINDILDIARIEAGRFDLSVEPIELDDLLEGSCALIGPLAKDYKVNLHQDSPAFPNCYVMADKRQLKQVVINLISNAIKYNRPEGDVIISWELTHSEKIRITVRDTGHGMAPEDLSKLFTPFERMGAASTDIEGTGLGLALSQRLLMAMGSELFAESILDEGSTFYFDLPPATAPEDVLANLAPIQKSSPNPSGRQYKVLIIEDNLSNLRLIEMVLESRSEVTLISALQGSIGLDLARQHEPDLILLDLHLPDMTGQQVLAHLRRSAITRDIPVVVISADATPTRIQRLLDAGIQAYLTKPLDVLDFLNVMDEAFRKNDSIPLPEGESN